MVDTRPPRNCRRAAEPVFSLPQDLSTVQEGCQALAGRIGEAASPTWDIHAVNNAGAAWGRGV